MGKYIARRTLLVIPVLFIVSVITFSIMQLAPGDPAAIVLGGDYIMYATAEEIEEVREKFLAYPELRSREKIKKLQFTFSPAEYEHYYKLLQTTKFRVIPEKDGEIYQQRKHYDYDPKDFEGCIDRIYEDSTYYRTTNGKGRRGWIGHMGWHAQVRNYITKIFLIENGEGLNLKSIAVTNDHGEIIDEKEKVRMKKE